MKILKSIQILTTVKEYEETPVAFLIAAKKQIIKGAHEVRIIGAGHTLAYFTCHAQIQEAYRCLTCGNKNK